MGHCTQHRVNLPAHGAHPPAHHTGKGPVYRGHTREGALAPSAGQWWAPHLSPIPAAQHVINSRLHIGSFT